MSLRSVYWFCGWDKSEIFGNNDVAEVYEWCKMESFFSQFWILTSLTLQDLKPYNCFHQIFPSTAMSGRKSRTMTKLISQTSASADFQLFFQTSELVRHCSFGFGNYRGEENRAVARINRFPGMLASRKVWVVDGAQIATKLAGHWSGKSSKILPANDACFAPEIGDHQQYLHLRGSWTKFLSHKVFRRSSLHLPSYFPFITFVAENMAETTIAYVCLYPSL